MNNANAQAEATIAAANEDAEGIRRSALEYTEELVVNLEAIISRTLEGARENSRALIDGLAYNHEILVSNKEALDSQLHAPMPGVEAPVVSQPSPSVQAPVYEEPAQQAEVPEYKETPVADEEDDEFDYDDID